MYSNVPTVSQAIRNILLANNIYLNAIRSGIANYTALAVKIKPEVEKITNSKVNTNTIVVSIKRLSDIIQEKEREDISKKDNEMIKGARISLTTSILGVEFGKETDAIEKILNLFDRDTDIRFNIFQTKNQIKLFIENIKEIKERFSKDFRQTPSKIKEGVSMLNITLPWPETEFEKTYQLLSIISNILYNNQIILHDAFFTPNEIVLIINDTDAAKAYELFRLKFYH